MKESYLKTGKIPTQEEWSKLLEWKSANPEKTWRRWDRHPSDNTLFFFYYNRHAQNGEKWKTVEKASESENGRWSVEQCLGFIAKRDEENDEHNRTIKKNETLKTLQSGKRISFYDLRRRPTIEEYNILREWIKENPSNKWRLFDPHPSIHGLFFLGYSKQRINGEYWGNAESVNRVKSKQKGIERFFWPNLKKRDIELEDSRRSYYSVDRGLTNDEYKKLKTWVQENPDQKWNRGDQHPVLENLFLYRICKVDAMGRDGSIKLQKNMKNSSLNPKGG